MWEKPKGICTAMRCTTRKYGHMMVESGSIKFNTPLTWISEELKKGKGRGDRFEGIFASCAFQNAPQVFWYLNEYDDVYTDQIGDQLYFRRLRTVHLPCYCFYVLTNDLLTEPKSSGKVKVTGLIPKEMFRDFMDHLSDDEVNALPQEEQPAVVIIKDTELFLAMIKKKLISLGVKESEIMIEQIEYQDKHTDFYCKAPSPKELRIKDKRFCYQSEVRVICNTDDVKIKELLLSRAIEIGSLASIAHYIEGYFDEGMLVEMDIVADIIEN